MGCFKIRQMLSLITIQTAERAFVWLYVIFKLNNKLIDKCLSDRIYPISL